MNLLFVMAILNLLYKFHYEKIPPPPPHPTKKRGGGGGGGGGIPVFPHFGMKPW